MSSLGSEIVVSMRICKCLKIVGGEGDDASDVHEGSSW
jgi:hypothetical protein